jgi:hypothetical protein
MLRKSLRPEEKIEPETVGLNWLSSHDSGFIPVGPIFTCGQGNVHGEDRHNEGNSATEREPFSLIHRRRERRLFTFSPVRNLS